MADQDALAQLLRDLDRLDAELLARLNNRAALAVRVAAQAEAELDRDAETLRRVGLLNQGPLSAATVTQIMRELLGACRALSAPVRVACLGPTGTFSELAAHMHFGREARVALGHSFDEVFRAVESRAVEFAVVPVENSSEGAVGRSLDLLAQSSASVCGEVLVPIHHQLLRKQGELPSIARVYSHAQSLGQCAAWLNTHLPHAERLAVASNAEAARLASEDPTSAAIAGEQAARPYGLRVVSANIQDEANNTTRFLVLGTRAPDPTGHDKTSLVISAKNEAGAVHALLAPLASRGVSMTRFESRPSRAVLWDYLFFVDIEGHRDDPNVAAALDDLTRIAGHLKVLGSYPAAVAP